MSINLHFWVCVQSFLQGELFTPPASPSSRSLRPLPWASRGTTWATPGPLALFVSSPLSPSAALCALRAQLPSRSPYCLRFSRLSYLGRLPRWSSVLHRFSAKSFDRRT